MIHYLEINQTLEQLNPTEVKTNKKTVYLNIECGFDIETTSIIQQDHKYAFMYIWQLGIGYGNPVYFGRTFDELKNCLDKVIESLTISMERRLVIYVHNLGYEFQFMRKHFEWDNVFSIDERKPIRALTKDGIEFRDSYILSGFSLANTARNLTKHKIKKLVGDLDYSLIRHHNTPLTHEEMQYCKNDIEIITAYINEQIEYYGTIADIPMTNTGRVRSYVRKYCYYRTTKDEKAGKGYYLRYRAIMDDLTLTPETYIQLKRSFMGGFTHANANHSGKVINDVSSLDFTSSYPSVMVSEKFPMSRFKPIEITSTDQFNKLIQTKAVIFDIKFNKIIQKIEQESYISESKCYQQEKVILNNGRVFSADSITTTITEVDFDIMKQCYSWESIEITNVKYAEKGYLPKAIIHSILKLYQDKTELKDVAGYEVEYMLSKGMLNSIYGMCVTDVVKNNALYDDDWSIERASINEEVEKYNTSKNRFLYYAWGIYVTAYARRNLWTAILSCGSDYIYSDTDSIKITNYEKYKPYFDWFNNQIIEKMEVMCKHYKFDTKLLNPKTNEGVEKMLGVWDFEGTYQQFKTLGAKRYLLNENGKLQLTVAGLSKANGLQYMESISNSTDEVFNLFNDNLYIPDTNTGKMTHTYIDHEAHLLVTDYLNQTRELKTLSGIHLEPCDFTLSINDQYLKFINNLSKGYLFKGTKFI